MCQRVLVLHPWKSLTSMQHKTSDEPVSFHDLEYGLLVLTSHLQYQTSLKSLQMRACCGGHQALLESEASNTKHSFLYYNTASLVVCSRHSEVFFSVVLLKRFCRCNLVKHFQHKMVSHCGISKSWCVTCFFCLQVQYLEHCPSVNHHVHAAGRHCWVRCLVLTMYL